MRQAAEAGPKAAHMSADDLDPAEGVIPFKPRAALPLRHSQFKSTARPDKPGRISKHVPGYTGFIPGVVSESMYGQTFPQQSIAALQGDKARFQFGPLEPEAQVRSAAWPGPPSRGERRCPARGRGLRPARAKLLPHPHPHPPLNPPSLPLPRST